MKTTFLRLTLAASILFFAASTAWYRPLTAAEPAFPVSGTIYGAFDYDQRAWVGHAILRFGDNAPLTATFVDRNTSFNMRNNGVIHGTETITFTFTNGSGTFEILATFTGNPQSAPSLYQLHESGTIDNGTGAYQNLSGQVSVQGPFLFPDPAATPGAAPWIAEIQGSVRGLQ